MSPRIKPQNKAAGQVLRVLTLLENEPPEAKFTVVARVAHSVAEPWSGPGSLAPEPTRSTTVVPDS